MDNATRFVKAIQLDAIDRIMTYDFIDHPQILAQFGGYEPTRRYTFDERVEIYAQTCKNIGLDITRFAPGLMDQWMDTKLANWTRFFGVDPSKWEISRTDGVSWISKRPFGSLAELEKHLPHLPHYDDVKRWYRPQLIHAQAGFKEKDIVLIGAIEGPLQDACTYMGMDLFVEAIFKAPDLLAYILDCSTAFSSHLTKVYAQDSMAPMLFLGEDIAGTAGPIFNPNFIRNAGLPRWKEITAPLEAKGMKMLFHSDGKYGDLLALIFNDLGADGLNPIERNDCNDIFQIRSQYPTKLLFGNVCSIRTLPEGTPGDVEDETLELIERLGPQGAIFIGSSSEIHAGVPLGNAVRMYETVREFGNYPIDGQRIEQRRRALRDGGKLSLRSGENG